MNINFPLSISVFRIFPLFRCPDVSRVISRWAEQQWFDMLGGWWGAPVWVGCEEAVRVAAAELFQLRGGVVEQWWRRAGTQHAFVCAGLHASVGLCARRPAWNVLWGERQIWAGDYDGTRQEPLPVEVCPLTVENTFCSGEETMGNFSRLWLGGVRHNFPDSSRTVPTVWLCES